MDRTASSYVFVTAERCVYIAKVLIDLVETPCRALVFRQGDKKSPVSTSDQVVARHADPKKSRNDDSVTLPEEIRVSKHVTR